MNDTMELLGRLYDSRKGLCDHFGISTMTASRWAALGVLPVPIKIGRTAFYDRAYVEEKLATGVAGQPVSDEVTEPVRRAKK